MRERRQALLVTSTALFASVLVWYNYSAVLPQIVDACGLTGTQAGIVFGIARERSGYAVAFPTHAAGAGLGFVSVGVLTWVRREDDA